MQILPSYLIGFVGGLEVYQGWKLLPSEGRRSLHIKLVPSGNPDNLFAMPHASKLSMQNM